MQPSEPGFVPPTNDYQSNLAVVDRFPFSLYHHPIRDHVVRTLEEESARGPLVVLNVGCGMSQILHHIGEQHHYVGLDIDPRNIEYCRNQYAHRQARFQLCDEYQLPFDSDSADFIFATEVIEHVGEPERWLGELLRVLKPGGRIQLSTPNYGDWTLPLIESTFLELVARSKGFTRKGLHPTPFSAESLFRLLRRAGLEEILLEKTPGNLALVVAARKPGPKLPKLDPFRLSGVFGELTRSIPTSLALREISRLTTLYQWLPEQTEILDVGCGDGSFWRAYPGVSKLTLDGVDLNSQELTLAGYTGIYRDLWTMDISRQRPERSYPWVLGNCSLEHVPNIHEALVNIRSCLDPQGKLLLFVPAFGWSRYLRMVRWLNAFGTRLGMAASGALDGFFQHHHLYDARTWQLLVQNAGYEVLDCRALGSPVLNRQFDRHLPVAFGEFLIKSLRKRYPDWRWLRPRLAGPVYEHMAQQPVPLESEGVVEYFLVAQPR